MNYKTDSDKKEIELFALNLDKDELAMLGFIAQLGISELVGNKVQVELVKAIIPLAFSNPTKAADITLSLKSKILRLVEAGLKVK